jgi:two-component system nitrate/nitrite response regulator NarL
MSAREIRESQTGKPILGSGKGRANCWVDIRIETPGPVITGRSRPIVPPSSGIHVLIVADVRLYREGLANGLASRKNMTIVGIAATRDEALTLVAAVQPEVVVLDMTTRDSLQVVRSINGAVRAVKIIAFGIEGLEQEILACAEAGVAGYVHCQASMDDLVDAIERVVRDEFLCPPRTAAMLLRHLKSLASGKSELPNSFTLTVREREIVLLIDGRLSNKEIAQRLHIEVATVKNHVHSILGKLKATTRADAAASLRRSGEHAMRSRLAYQH